MGLDILSKGCTKTIYRTLAVPDYADNEYKKSAYIRTREEFWRDLGKTLYEAGGIHTVEISEEVRADDGVGLAITYVTFKGHITKVDHRHVEVHSIIQMDYHERRWVDKVMDKIRGLFK